MMGNLGAIFKSFRKRKMASMKSESSDDGTLFEKLSKMRNRRKGTFLKRGSKMSMYK
jgi:hypothetical protein